MSEKRERWREREVKSQLYLILVHKGLQEAALKGNLFFTARQLILMSGIIKMAEVPCIST